MGAGDRTCCHTHFHIYIHFEENYDLASNCSPISLTLWDTVINKRLPPIFRQIGKEIGKDLEKI